MGNAAKVAIVLHGDYGNPDDIRIWTNEADFVVAADGAADVLLELGITPDKVIGDLDGIRADTIQELPPDRVIAEDDQNTTDFQKAIAFVKKNHPNSRIAILNFEGSRLDHVLSTLTSAPEGAILVGKEALVRVLGTGEHWLSTAIRGRVSLVPLPAASVSGSQGLLFDPSGLRLEEGGRGLSNEATQSEVVLQISSGRLLAFVQRFEGEHRW